MKILNTHGQFCIGNEIDFLSMYETVAAGIKFKYEKSLKLRREFSAREKHLGNANYDYIPNPSFAIPKVLEAYAASSKPQSESFKYLGDKYPRVYWKSKFSPLNSLAHEDFAEVTLIHVTRSPLEAINSIFRRINNAKIGADSWSGIKDLDQAINEWKHAWNARNLYSKTPFRKVIDLNYNALVHDPSGSLEKIAATLEVDNSFDSSIVSNASINWCLDQSQRSKIASSFPSAMLCNDWEKFGLFLDRHSFIFNS